MLKKKVRSLCLAGGFCLLTQVFLNGQLWANAEDASSAIAAKNIFFMMVGLKHQDTLALSF